MSGQFCVLSIIAFVGALTPAIGRQLFVAPFPPSPDQPYTSPPKTLTATRFDNATSLAEAPVVTYVLHPVHHVDSGNGITVTCLWVALGIVAMMAAGFFLAAIEKQWARHVLNRRPGGRIVFADMEGGATVVIQPDGTAAQRPTFVPQCSRAIQYYHFQYLSNGARIEPRVDASEDQGQVKGGKS